MAESLEYLIQMAREYREKYGFSPEERERQVRSFAYGNTHFENESISKSDIDDAMKALEKGTEETVCS